MEYGKKGDRAVYDSIVGLVPCKAIEVRYGLDGRIMIDLQVTKARGPYHKGYIIADVSVLWAAPRSAVRRTKLGQERLAAYEWLVD